MLNQHEIMQTIQMIDQQHLDVRTITMGISLLSCAHSDIKVACDKVYDKITRSAEHLVTTGEAIEQEFGIPIVNKRISVTPIALVGAACDAKNYAPFAAAMDRAAKATGVNFIGGFSALVQKGMTEADRILIDSIPEALSTTDIVCSSVNVGSTKAGIDMDAVALMGRTIKALAAATADRGGFGCAKLVVFCNAVEDNPFMAGAFHGVGDKFHFTGFLNKQKVNELLSMTDVYCMPSVSEPFGLSALEAAQFNIPAVISKQSGVAEVMKGALKADFWDVNMMAKHIVDLVTDEELYKKVAEQSAQDIKNSNWETAADKMLRVYHHVLGW